MKNLLSIAIQASIDAGKAIMEVYAEKIDVEIKEDKSPLTQADKNANDVINNYLTNTRIPIISEENKQLDYSQRKDWEFCWIVDPLDGTKEFIKRNGEFTVNIALIKNGNPLLGVIYVPVSKTLYYTLEDASKSYKIDLENEDVSLDFIFKNSIEIKPSENNNGLIRIVGSRSHLNEATKEFISKIENNKKTEIVSKGSSLKFCLVAEGTADVYPRFAPTMEWDTAAGQAICQAVGVQVIDDNTNLPLKYNKENLLNPNFLVSI
jgi:3'(2'), 5'-bisphosphate nucleotidase